ncbi:hypothetical protein Q8791_02455 [Nocardiopsis sp. CT-R113]|uniref:DUF4190 domain-containing protein n=1 Tax=Nocardiopsis codii TaxID=3065942 RepID=A0ABU7K1N0_9ACTN|nr:hypothetical protein [Nocardiopsis sp. CT-R113]MEE2036084.1 hypothetical protein [Nocardiopsis sp. CT-R113]
MTEHGGGRDSGAGDWFKPSENRYRTQSEYQDPLEGEEAEENTETVFPDSGGYAGLSASRPALVEPYPEALGGPPSGGSATSNSISYPGAGLSSYQPLTRVPGEQEEPSLPSVAASAQVPLPSEDPAEGPGGRMDSWAAPRTDRTVGGADAPADREDVWPTGLNDAQSAAPGEGAFHGAGYSGQDRASDAWRDDDPLGAPRGSAAWDADAPLGGADERGRDTWGQDGPAAGAGERAGDAWGGAPADSSDAPDHDAWRTDAPERGFGEEDREAWAPAPARDAEAWTPDPVGDARPWDDAPDDRSGSAAPAEGPAAWDADAPRGSAAWEPDASRGSAAWDADASRGSAAWDADAPLGGTDERGRGAWDPDSRPDERAGAPWGADAPAGRPDDHDTGHWTPGAPEGGTASSGFGAPDRVASDADASDARPWDDEPAGAGGPETWAPAPGRDDDAWTPGTSPETRSWEPDPALGGVGEPVRDTWGDDAPAGRSDDPERWSPDAPVGGAASSGFGASDPLASDTRPWNDGLGGGPTDSWKPSAEGGDRSWDDAPAGGSDRPWDDAPSGYRAADSADRPWDEDRGTDSAGWGTGATASDTTADRAGAAPAAPLWDDELSDDRGTADWGADAPVDGSAGTGPDSWNAAARHGAETYGAPYDTRATADGGRSWDDDELGSDSWGASADRGAPSDAAWDAPDGATAGPDGDSWRSTSTETNDLDSWAPARDTGDTWSGAGTNESWTDGYDDELSPPTPDQSTLGSGSGNTWAFDRNDPRLPDVVREAEERRRESAGTPDRNTWGGSATDPEPSEWSSADQDPDADDRWDGTGADEGRTSVPASDDPLAAIADMQSRARSREAGGFADEEPQDAPARRGGFADDDVPDGATQVFEAPSIPEDTWEHDEPEPSGESEYDDGFTPADYGMPEAPASRRRRKDRIAEDFPGFVDRPLGGELGDPYPGYDSIDFLPDTERGATVTLWLGIASLLPGIGLVTALLALLITGPKAKKAIRASRGELDGLGLITVGTVFAVLGILVTVISVAIWLVL